MNLPETCDAVSPGGNLHCVLILHDDARGHVWEHPSAGGDRKEDCIEETLSYNL